MGLCAAHAARAMGASRVIAIDSVPARLAVAEGYGAEPVHLLEGDPRAAVRSATAGRGVDVCIDAVGDPKALELALRLTRKCGTVQAVGVYAERCEVHMGLFWIKALELRAGHANVIGHLDSVLALMSAGHARPERARQPPYGARGGPGGVRDLRSPRGAEDHPAAMTAAREQDVRRRPGRSERRVHRRISASGRGTLRP